jgi:hypothetical protein
VPSPPNIQAPPAASIVFAMAFTHTVRGWVVGTDHKHQSLPHVATKAKTHEEMQVTQQIRPSQKQVRLKPT